MKHKLLMHTMACCTMVSLLGVTATAKPDGSSSGSSSDPNAGGASSSRPAPASTAILSPTSSRPQHTERLSQLMGVTVKDQEGNTLGQINDFVINPMAGRIQYAVISLNDQAGKLTAVPWQLLRHGADASSCTLAVSKGKLSSAQTFDASSWPDFNQPSTEQQIYSHFGVQPGRAGSWGSASGNESGPGASDYNKSGSTGAPGTGATSGTGTGGTEKTPKHR